MEIYADVLFAVNFIMDFIILWATGKLLRKNATAFRLCLGALAMSISYCLVVFFAPATVFNIACYLFILLLGVWLSLRPYTIKAFACALACALCCTFALGGMGMALYFLINKGIIHGALAAAAINNFSFNTLILSTVGFYAAIKIVTNWYNRITVKKQALYNVKIFLDNYSISLTALLDTGNTLKDPVSSKPVIIAEFEALKRFLPDSIRLIFYENKEDNLPAVLEYISSTGFYGRFRMIPFSSLGTPHGLLLGFRPDKVEIENNSGSTIQCDVIIGIYNRKLAGDGSYRGLLNPETLAFRHAGEINKCAKKFSGEGNF